MQAFARDRAPPAEEASARAACAWNHNGKSSPAKLSAPARNTSRRRIGAAVKKSRQAVGARAFIAGQSTANIGVNQEGCDGADRHSLPIADNLKDNNLAIYGRAADSWQSRWCRQVGKTEGPKRLRYAGA